MLQRRPRRGSLLSQAGFVIISASNTAPDLTRAGDPNQHPGYLRTAHNDEVQGAAAAKFAFEEMGVKKAATIHDGSLYAESLQGVFAKSFKEMGGEITTQEAVDPNGTDFKSVLTSIAAGEPEFIYMPIFVKAGSLIVNQAKQVPGLETVYLMAPMVCSHLMSPKALAMQLRVRSSPAPTLLPLAQIIKPCSCQNTRNYPV